jgi:3D-(3,5/4)-trihydroxycyclohexane-1,2-dione acylhydrolase (decyclizing)
VGPRRGHGAAAMSEESVTIQRRNAAMRKRARAIRNAGGLSAALASGALHHQVKVSLSEATVLGLLRQGISKYLVVFGHGCTDLAEVLRIYEEEGVTRTFNCRNEVAMSHAATALSWIYHEACAVVASIGPGALQAMAGSLSAASNGVGLYHIYGDETTYGEGYNMQQVPKREQHLYGRLTAIMGESYVLHTPEALREALRRGAVSVFHPYRKHPFYLLLPINKQPSELELNLGALPGRPEVPLVAPVQSETYDEAARIIANAAKVAIKAGGGTRGHDAAIARLAEAAGAAVVLSPGSTGVLPDAHPQNLHVGGSKGSISGNYAMSEAEVVVVIGSRAVCQADCSGIGYKSARVVININGELSDALHYNNTFALVGDIGFIAERLSDALDSFDRNPAKREWLADCLLKKKEWTAFKNARFLSPSINDDVWQRPVLGQPAAIKAVADFARSIDAVKIFDAGDVQANGFQIVEDDCSNQTFTEAGASYMGFAVSSLLASGLADAPRYAIAFSGDGSFTMNPQVLVDAVEHGARGMVVIFDNRCMAAIGALQREQYGCEFKINDNVSIDFVRLASSISNVSAVFGGYDIASLKQALQQAYRPDGISVVHVPVYAGVDEMGGLGAWGDWNVGNWCNAVQREWMRQDL